MSGRLMQQQLKVADEHQLSRATYACRWDKVHVLCRVIAIQIWLADD